MTTASAERRYPELRERGSTAPGLLEVLRDPRTYGSSEPVLVRETHASWVFLTGDHAYKVKKPVSLGFLDYSTLALRHAACREEVRVNATLAGAIYLGVLAVIATNDGYRLAQEDAPEAVEYVVHMRRFDEASTMQAAIRSRTLTPGRIQTVAQRLFDFHLRSPGVLGGAPEDLIAAWQANIDVLERTPHPAAWNVPRMRRFGEAFVKAHRREIDGRVLRGEICDGHGDLRCEHILLTDPIRIVDRIEFDPALRHLDVAADLAFLEMDLEAHHQRRAARELVSAYRHAGGHPASEQLRSFYGAHWALVRAKVALIAAAERKGSARRGELAHAKSLWGLAQRLSWRARRPLAVVVCGPAASGKSTLAAALARVSRLPVVSSDHVRKHLAGLEATERAGPEHYTLAFTQATYRQLTRDALAELDRHGGVIVDATCQSRGQRATLFQRLKASRCTLLVVQCRASRETVLARAEARMRSHDRVSDATPQLVAERFDRFEALDELPADLLLALDCEPNVDRQLSRITDAIDEHMSTR